MRLTSNTSKADTEHRRNSGLLFHIHCRGLTKSKGRAEAYREYDWWKDMRKQMCQYLRNEGYAEDARQLRDDMKFLEHMNAFYVTIHPDSWHIFTYALRALDNNAYMRVMAQRSRDANDTGWR